MPISPRLGRRTAPPRTEALWAASVVFGALMLLAEGCSGQNTTLKQVAVIVPTSRTQVRTVQPVVSLSGLVAPLQNVAITSDLLEPANTVAVNEGDRVARGQLLAQLSVTDLQAQLDAAVRSAAEADAKVAQTRYQAQYAIATGGDQVKTAQAQLDLAEGTLQRDRQLYSQGYISAQDLQSQQTVVSSAQAALSTAIENQRINGNQNQGLQQANVEAAIAAAASAHAQAESLQAQIAKAAIVSPVDGVVVNRNLNPGEYPGARQIFTLQQVSSVYAALNAFGAQVSGITKGTPVTLTSPAVPGRSFGGTVVAVLSPTTPSAAGFIVKVVIPNPSRALMPGMTVAAHVGKRQVSGVTVPVSAFIDDTHKTLYTLDADDKVHIVQVQELARGQTYSVVQGLPSGATVVSDGTLAIIDGQHVQREDGQAAQAH